MRLLLSPLYVIIVSTCFAQREDSNNLVYRDTEYSFSYHYPRSWAQVEATHTATRFKAVSDGGFGSEDVSINVVPNPNAKGKPPTAHFINIKSDPEAYVTTLRRSIPTVQLLYHGETTLSNQPAYYLIIDYTFSSAGIDIPIRQMQIFTGRDGINYTITLRCDPALWSERSQSLRLLATGFVLHPKN